MAQLRELGRGESDELSAEDVLTKGGDVLMKGGDVLTMAGDVLMTAEGNVPCKLFGECLG